MKSPDYDDLSEQDFEMIKTELAHEFERQEDLQTERARRIKECDPQRLLPRIEELEKWQEKATILMQAQHNNIDRLIKLLEHMKLRS